MWGSSGRVMVFLAGERAAKHALRAPWTAPRRMVRRGAFQGTVKVHAVLAGIRIASYSKAAISLFLKRNGSPTVACDFCNYPAETVSL